MRRLRSGVPDSLCVRRAARARAVLDTNRDAAPALPNDPKSFPGTAAARRHEKLAFSFSQWYDAKTWMSGIGVSGGTPAPGVGSMQPVCMLSGEKAQGLLLPLEKVENEVKIIWVAIWAIALGPYGNKTQYPGLAQLVARLLWECRGCIRVG